MKVVLSPNPYRDKGLKAAQAAQQILRSAGVETAMCLPFTLERGSRMDLPKGLKLSPIQEELAQAEMLICFGGDGTILHAAKDAAANSIPILGVNMGSVGFMAELEQGELSLLAKLPERKYEIESRMMLDVQVVHDGRTIHADRALNDAVITKGAIARIIDLTVFGDGEVLSDFAGDGIVFCTPTGSTAYSMSAGGPIVEPTAENIIVTPICAHSLKARTLVLGCSRVVSARLGRLTRKTAYLSVDGGRAFKLSAGDTVEIRRSAQVTRLVRLTGRSFYEILNQKLGRG